MRVVSDISYGAPRFKLGAVPGNGIKNLKLKDLSDLRVDLFGHQRYRRERPQLLCDFQCLERDVLVKGEQ